MNKLLEKAIHTIIHKQFELWNEQENIIEDIEKALFRHCTDNDSKEKVYAKMIINSIEIAAEISAKIIVEILLASEVFESVDERRLRKNLLSIVKEQSSEFGIN